MIVSSKGSVMHPGDSLAPGESLVSQNQLFELTYQADGDLVLYARSPAGKTLIWSSKTKGTPAGSASFDPDGYLVVRDPKGEVRWTSSNWYAPVGRPELRMQDDQNLVAYDANRRPYWATNTWLTRYALLIGVEDYDNYPDQALRAGRNDVLALWQVCRRLGYRPEYIRVRTSPRLTREQILEAEVDMALGHKENRGKTRSRVREEVEAQLEHVKNWDDAKDPVLGDATHESISAAVTWLRDRLGQPFTNGQGFVVPGMLAYSGHGARIEGDLALCPSDVKWAGGGKIENALSFREIQDILIQPDKERGDAFSPIEYLTVVLDCCFAGASGIQENQVVTALTPPSDQGPAAGTRRPQVTIDSKLGQRIFCASRQDEQACQALLGGRWHGAFTWAFTQALEQWTIATSGLFSYIDVSHVELLFRTRMLLEALSFPQHPMLMDSIGNTPVFWSGSERIEMPTTAGVATSAPTHADPDAERAGVQLDPSGFVGEDLAVLTLTAAAGVATVVMAVNGEVQVKDRDGAVVMTYEPKAEYWYMNGTFDTATATSLEIATQGVGSRGFIVPQGRLTPLSQDVAAWGSGTPDVEGTYPFKDRAVRFGVSLRYTSNGGTVTWFHDIDHNVPVKPIGNTTLSSATRPPIFSSPPATLR